VARARDDAGQEPEDVARWDEGDSEVFRRLGAIFVPGREQQSRVLTDLIPGSAEPFEVVELGCGEGLLAEAVLARWSSARVTGLDGSAAMIAAAERRHERHGARFRTLHGDLAAVRELWRGDPPRAIVSSLALHHLRDEEKQELFAWASATLAPGGRILVADLVWPIERAARDLAASQWDEAVDAAAGRAGDDGAARVFREDGWNMYALPEPDPEDHPAPLHRQLDWMRAAGLTAVDVYWMFAGHAIFGGTAPSHPT
jgi:tRNA (cmo5U34)-methyltransferase